MKYRYIDHSYNAQLYKQCIRAYIEDLATSPTDYKKDFKTLRIQIMFAPMRGNQDHVLLDMSKAIYENFYSRFCTRVVRNPKSAINAEKLPRLLMFPDRPVHKHGSGFPSDVVFNHGGLHYIGIIQVPRQSRLNTTVVRHFRNHQHVYCSGDIENVWVGKMKRTPEVWADYCLKAVKRDHQLLDHVVAAPRPRNSETAQPRSSAKDVQAATNISPELCELIADRFY